MNSKFSKILIALLVVYSFTLSNSFGAEFGRYGLYNGDYRGYALQQTLKAQQNRANLVRQRHNYYSNPTRRIKYPTSNNPYPNIQRNNYQRNIPQRQRYSAKYYETMY